MRILYTENKPTGHQIFFDQKSKNGMNRTKAVYNFRHILDEAICFSYRNSGRKTKNSLPFANRNYRRIYTSSCLLTSTKWRILIEIPTRNADGFAYFHWFSISNSHMSIALEISELNSIENMILKYRCKKRFGLHCAFIQLSHG